MVVHVLDAPEAPATPCAPPAPWRSRPVAGRGADRPAPDRRQGFEREPMDRTATSDFPLRRREVAAELLADRGDLLVVAGLGCTAWDVTAAGDHPLNFPLVGRHGRRRDDRARPRARAAERRVLVITGDGEHADGPRLARHDRRAAAAESRDRGDRQRALRRDRHAGDPHRARRRPRRRRGGLRASRDRHRARGERARRRPAHSCTAPGPVLYVAKVRAEPLPFALPPKDGAYLKDRFRQALLGRSVLRRCAPLTLALRRVV